MDTARSQLLAVALPLLGSTRFPIEVVIRDCDGAAIAFTFTGREVGSTPAPAVEAPASPATVVAAAPHVRLGRIHRKILEQANGTPVPAKRLLSLAGYHYNTYGREAVAFLTNARMLARLPSGLVRGPAATVQPVQ